MKSCRNLSGMCWGCIKGGVPALFHQTEKHRLVKCMIIRLGSIWDVTFNSICMHAGLDGEYITQSSFTYL